MGACKCSPESQRMRIKSMTFPMNPPFVMGEISGEYLGWIDEYLAILGVYLVAIEAKYEDEIESLGIKSNMSQIAMFIIGIRANYWYFITSERSRAMSEVQFTQRMHLISAHIVDKDTKHLHEIDTAFKSLSHKNVWWETFLHHLATFYRRLRSTRYVILGTENIPKNKKKEFDLFEHLHENAMLNLSKSVEILLPMSPSKKLGDLLPGFLAQLSSDQNCMVCNLNIGGKRAQFQLYRLNLLRQYVRGEITEIECKANPDYKELGDFNEDECFAYCLSAIRPGCVGDNFINFNKFNQLICDCEDQLLKRFREFIVTGMCHCCQVYYIERPDEGNPNSFGNVFLKCTRVKSLNGLAVQTV